MTDQQIHDGSYAAAYWVHAHPLVGIVAIVCLLLLAVRLWRIP